MSDGYWRRGPRRRPRPRRRLTGCLVLIGAIVVILIILSLLFGGFQKGTKADGAGAAAPVPATAALRAAPATTRGGAR
jgi:hypothetical protein